MWTEGSNLLFSFTYVRAIYSARVGTQIYNFLPTTALAATSDKDVILRKCATLHTVQADVWSIKRLQCSSLALKPWPSFLSSSPPPHSPRRARVYSTLPLSDGHVIRILSLPTASLALSWSLRWEHSTRIETTSTPR